MTANTPFYHAIDVDCDRCIGCANCMKACPTEAIRIHQGVAHILENRCIDCGKCHSGCPTGAMEIKQDDFEQIRRYPHSVALVPAVFLSQFPDDIGEARIYATIKELGFQHVFEVESAVDIFEAAKARYADDHTDDEPLISSFCPAIVRLIQVRYPSLVGNIMPIKAPLDFSAMYAVRILEEQGVPRTDIGIFYITPCAAKIAAVKKPVGEAQSIIDGVINMDSLYNKVYKKLKEQGNNYTQRHFDSPRLGSDAVQLTLTGGERRLSAKPRSYAIDGIKNCIDFLDRLENDEVTGVNFLELRACDQSCAGATLGCENRFLCSERMYARARQSAKSEQQGFAARSREMEQQREYLLENSEVEPVRPRSMMVLDTDLQRAIEKAEQVQRLKRQLPQIDCALCGAPSCGAFATDLVAGQTTIDNCIFYRHYIATHSGADRPANLETIWGHNRISGIINLPPKT